ncbi:hypothetical protein ABEW34_13685 [Paenibacillus algorifonticola]|uniref:hypothetical protein n=1 Tax=Paenibacillus algorifonticola TaxID=684063 RepID=UPI003D2A21BE
MKKWLILSLLLLWLLPSPASALSCAQMKTPAEAFDWYDGIGGPDLGSYKWTE